MPERMSMSNEEQTVENKQPHGASEPWAKAAEYGGPQSCQGPSLQGTGVLHLVDLITPFVWFFLATHHNPVFSAAARTLLLPMLLYFLPLASRHLVLNSPFAYTPSVCACSVTTVVSNSVRPHGLQPTRLPCPWGSQARTLEWVATHSSRARPDPRIKPRSVISPAPAGRFFTTSSTTSIFSLAPECSLNLVSSTRPRPSHSEMPPSLTTGSTCPWSHSGPDWPARITKPPHLEAHISWRRSSLSFPLAVSFPSSTYSP